MFPKRCRLIRFSLSITLLLQSFAKASIQNPIDPFEHDNTTTAEAASSIQSRPCTMFQVVVDDDDNGTIIENESGGRYHRQDHSIWRCQLDDLGDGFVNVDGIDWVLLNNPNLQSGVTTLLADGGMLQSKRLVIPPNHRLKFGTTTKPIARAKSTSQSIFNPHRTDAPTDFGRVTGTKTVLAVRVKTLDASPSYSQDTMADEIFGINGDKVNLKSQLEGCSYGKLHVEPASVNGVGCRDNSNFTYFKTFGDGTVGNCNHFEKRHDTTDYCVAFGNSPDAGGMTANEACCVCGGGITWYYSRRDIVNGVMEIELDLSIADSDNFALEEKAVKVLEATFGGNKLFTMFDHVMICLPPGAKMYGSPAWRAYAYVNHYLSVYHDDWCIYPKTTVHEIAHNFGLTHSWISLEEGQEETVMGRGYPVDEGPMRAQVCFNPAKSYQLGWYQDKVMELNLSSTPKWQGVLVGVGNYHSTRKDAMVVIKIPGADKEDLYVGYNHAIRNHRGTFYGANKVKIVRQGQGFLAESWVESILGPGEAHVVPNFVGNQHLTIQVLNTSSYPDGFAEVNIFTFETNDYCVDNGDFLLLVNSTFGRVSCWWIRENEPIGCPRLGNGYGSCGTDNFCTARFECCHCGGGRRTRMPPSSAPTVIPLEYAVASQGRRNGRIDLLFLSLLRLSFYFATL